MAAIPDKVQIGSSQDYLEGVAVDTAAGNGLFREGVVVSDPELEGARQRVLETEPAADDFGAVTRVIGLNDKLDQLIAKPSAGGAQDYFGNTVISQRTNQIEVPFNDANWQDYVIIAPPQSPATATQANGEALFQTGVGGVYSLQSRDVVRYRAGAEIGWGFTWRLDSFTAGRARIGVSTDNNFTDGVFVEYFDSTFHVVYKRNGATVQTWPLTLDQTVNQLFRIRAGLFGYAGFIVEALSGAWQTVAEFVGIGTDQPVFVDYDMGIHANVTGTDVTLATGCWAGWTGVSLKRVSDAFTDRTLVQATQSVIVGKTTDGGSGYVPVKVNPSGTLAVGNTSVGQTGSPVPAESTYVAVNDGSGTLVPLVQPTTPADTQPVSAASLPLPTGAATEAKQLPDNHQVSVSNFPATQPVSVSSLPLPSGAATQTTLAAVLAALQATLTAQITGEVEVKNDSGNPLPVSGTVSSLDSSEREYTPVVRNVTASGDTTVYTPSVGKRVRLHKLIIANDPNAGSSPLITVKMGTTSYHMLFNAAIRQVDTGPVEAGGGEGALKVNLSQAGNVACTFRLEEV